MIDIKRGLEGVVFAETSLSEIDGQRGELSYCGYDINDLADQASFEEIAFLLWYQRLPAADELEMLSGWIRKNRLLPKTVWGIMHSLPEGATTMEALRTIVSTLSMFDKACKHEEVGGSSMCRSVSLMGKLPTIVTSFDRLRRGLPPIEPRQDLGHGANFLYMLTGEEPDQVSARALETYLVLLAEHGMNPSTFSGRVTASTRGDIYSAVVTALGTLKGELHGGASHKVMQQLMEINMVENLDGWFEQKMEEGERIFGFGHRVYKAKDPRSDILREMARQAAEHQGESRWFEIATALEERVLDHPYFQERNLVTNVDFYTAPLLYALGIRIDQFTPMFAMARIAGWTAHALEQQRDNRLIRPRAHYVGERDLALTQISDREPAVEVDLEAQCVVGKPANCPAALEDPPRF